MECWLAAVALLAAAALCRRSAQDYPSRPIRLLIHTPPGSLVDVLGRLVGQELGERLGQSFVADNRTGAATMIAVEQLIHSPPDGYTLMINSSEATMLPFLKKSYRYDPIKDFTPVALVVTSWTVFAVNPKVPANTLPELVAYSKSNPGGVRYGSGGTGGVLHIAVEMLKLKSGGNFVHVPYRGGAQAATDAISGQIEMVSMGLASTRVADERPAAHPGADRPEPASDAARRADHGRGRTCRTCGWRPGSAWSARPACRRRSSRASTASLRWSRRQPAFQDKLAKLGLAVDFKPDAEFIAFMADDTKKWRELIPAMGIPQVD